MRKLIAAALGTAALATAVAACGSSGITAHGTEMVCGDVTTGQSGLDVAPDITAGGQVVVVDPSGKVIGTTVLTDPGPTAARNAATAQLDTLWNFTVTVPGGEARYGIQVGQGHGTVWASPQQMTAGPGLSLNC